MANIIGGMLITLGLDAADFRGGLSKAEYQAKQSAAALKRQFESIGTTIKSVGAAIGVGLGADAFKDMVLGAYDAQEELSNLGKRAGLTGSELSSLSTAAKLTHTSLEDVANMSAKISKALLDFGNQTAQSTVVLKALGVRAEDIPGLLAKPADALLKLAKLINTLPEGGTKAAAQLLIVGRAGGTTSAYMAELAQQTELVKTKTDEEIEAAKRFNDQLTLLGISADKTKTIFANAILPTLDAVLKAFADASAGPDGLQAKIKELAADGSLERWARDTVLVLGTVVEGFVLAARIVNATASSFRVVAADIQAELAKTNAPSQKPFGALGFSAEEIIKYENEYRAAVRNQIEVKKQADQAYIDLWNANGVAITDAIKKSFAKQDAALKEPPTRQNADRQVDAYNAGKKAADARAKGVQDALNANANRGAADDPARKVLDGLIKAEEAAIQRERDILQARQDFIRDNYQDGLISTQQYYAQLEDARQTNLQSTLTAYEREIQALEAYRAKATTKVAKEDATNRIAEAREKEAKAIRDNATASDNAERDRQRAAQLYADQLDEINAKMADIAGNTAKAAAIRFDAASRVFLGQNPQAKPASDALRAQQIIAAEMSDNQKKFALVTDDVAIAQERLNILQSTGAVGEIDYLNQLSAINKARIADLQKIADAQLAIAQASQDPAALNMARRMQLEIDKLASQTDLLGQKINKVFANEFTDALTAVVTGTKSVKDAFNDMARNISNAIARIAAENLAAKLFGGTAGGQGFDIGAMLAKLLGSLAGGGFGTGGGSSPGFAGGTIDWNSVPSIPGTPSFGYAANGTMSARGGWTVVGEHGKELMNVPHGAQIIPMNRMRGGGGKTITNTFNVNVMPGATTASAQQAGNQLRKVVMQSLRDRTA